LWVLVGAGECWLVLVGVSVVLVLDGVGWWWLILVMLSAGEMMMVLMAFPLFTMYMCCWGCGEVPLLHK